MAGESLNCCGERVEDVSFYGVWDFNATMRKGERKKMSTTVTFTVRLYGAREEGYFEHQV